MQNGKKVEGIIFVAVMIWFTLVGSQCQWYRFKTQELQEELVNEDELIREYKEEMKGLRTQLKDGTTETGFEKKDTFYLIDDRLQLEKLAQMIKEGAEIEPGVAAAEAAYRLRNNLEVKDWFSIGTEQMPFRGSFDGDGHSITGNLAGHDNTTGVLFRTTESAKVENLKIQNAMDNYPYSKVYIVVDDEEECREIGKNLTEFPECRVQLSLEAWNLDTQEIADSMRERWERNKEQKNYYVSVFFYPRYREEETVQEPLTENTMTPFCMMAGEEWGKIIEETVEQEEGYLRFLRLERIKGLKCCTFEIGMIEHGYNRIVGEDDGYHIILEGEWEGKQVPMQHLFIPYTSSSPQYDLGEYNNLESKWEKGWSSLENVDINFDGKQDLLIHEGSSSGTGGSSYIFRAIVWNGETGQFEYYPSFPVSLDSLQFDRQRVISAWRMGAGEQHVAVYGVVNGEYVCTEELVWEEQYSEEEDKRIPVLLHYKMGKLVETHRLSGDVFDQETELEQLYPDLSYWGRG